MKAGRSLVELAQELTRQMETKKDYAAPAAELELKVLPAEPPAEPADPRAPVPAPATELKVNGHGAFRLTDFGHRQLGERMDIPAKYYDLMRHHAPELLAHNVNHWLRSDPAERHLVRTLDGKARAILSTRYRRLDNFDLAEAALPALVDGGAEIVSTELTENKFYIKALFPKTELEVRKGDVVQAGIVITNSETGMGRLAIQPLVYRLVCTNGMIANDASLRQYHVGRAADIGMAQELFRDETLLADDRAFFMKVQDVIRGTFSADVFPRLVERMALTTENPINRDPVKAVEVTAKKFSLSEGERTGVLGHLLAGGMLTQYGLLNAITRYSQDVQDYDRATDFERMGGQVLELSPSDWREIAGPAK